MDEHAGHHHALEAQDAAAAITDPVCGMQVNPATSKHRFQHAGTTFHFCSAGCRTKFEADPAKYLAPKAPRSAPANTDAVYTCPMHPEIRQHGPGSCPICGMALEPLEVTAEAAPNHELQDMTRRFWIGLILALPVFVLEMGGHIPALGLHDLVPPRISIWIQFVLSTPVVLWAGW
ncbi:MAG: P-type Cu+ transporter, partial [Acetobacteraceae bacterium]|nr:P-type Cu+ transporter [Acetobacteraceae bacterium]